MKKLQTLILIFILLTTTVPSSMGASGSTKFTVGGTVALSEDLQTVPDSTTALSTTDTWIFQITIVNTTGSAATITMQDRATSPKTLLAAVSIAANTTYVIAFPEGQKMKNGITWSAGTTSALQGSIKAKRI